jgi:hypothetical protein
MSHVNIALRWTFKGDAALYDIWRAEGFKYVICNEPGYGSGTNDNALGVKLESDEISGYELAWTYAINLEVKEGWDRLGYASVRCNEPGLDPNSYDNWFAIRVITKDPAKKAEVSLEWNYATTVDTLDAWTARGFTYTRCGDPGLGGRGYYPTLDNYLAMRINIVDR